MRLILKKDGNLFLEKWHYDDEKDTGQYIQEDVTNDAQKYLFWPCCELEDVKLKDVLLFAQKHQFLLEIIISPYVGAYIEEILENSQSDDAIEYLTIEHYLEFFEDGILEFDMPRFSGVGYKEYGCPRYGFSASAASIVAETPLKLGGCYIYNNTIDDISERQICDWDKATFTLGQILSAIFFELSWYGSPKQRDEQTTEIIEIKTGCVDAIISVPCPPIESDIK